MLAGLPSDAAYCSICSHNTAGLSVALLVQFVLELLLNCLPGGSASASILLQRIVSHASCFHRWWMVRVFIGQLRQLTHAKP